MVWEQDDSWERKFQKAREYYEIHGNLDIPATYVTEDGISLGAWYRSVRNQYRDGTLSAERRRKLEDIGIQWKPVRARGWLQYYELAEQYYRAYGNLNVSADYETPEGIKLGVWISGQRYGLKKGRVTAEQKRMLDEIGMEWDRFAGRWQAGYEHAQAYIAQHGSSDIPRTYVCQDGYTLGRWIYSQRRRYRSGALEQEKIDRLAEIGVVLGGMR